MDKPQAILPQVLSELDKAALIELIIQQGERLQELWQQNEGLQQQNETLRKQLEELEKAAKRPVAPFRIADKDRKGHKKRSGAPVGHPAHYRKVSGPIDEQIEVQLAACPHCQGAVSAVKPLGQVIEELVVRPWRVSLTTYEGHCSRCGRVRSRHGYQTTTASGSAGCQLGINAATVAVLLNHRYGMSKRKVCELFSDYFHLPLSIGGLVQLQHRLAQGLEPDYQHLRQQARQSSVLYSDETSWYVGEPKGWLWTFTNADFTLYQVAQSRGREVIEGLIGKNYPGVLVSDCLVVYENVSQKQQKCYAHHLRAIGKALQAEPQSQYLLDWQALLLSAIEHKKQQGRLSQEDYQDGMVNLSARAAKLLQPQWAWPQRASPAEEQIFKRLSKQADHLFTFLNYPQVEATNNRAERSLRPAVIQRKIACGNKTRKGADTWQILASLVVTTHQNQMDFSQKVRAVYQQRL
jgi:hypothetical protein